MSKPSRALEVGAPEASRRGSVLRPIECFAAFLILSGWLVLFTGGILIDTKPYRYAISPEGVWVMDGTIERPIEERYRPNEAVNEGPRAWSLVLFFYLPANLALLCVTAGALGAFGSRANLESEETVRMDTDNSNPYVSAVLRGFFVYLFLTSGLLLLDDNPFSDPSPAQYIRLAGFLSLMSFVINYQPHVFGQLVTWAFQRIQARGGEPEQNVLKGDSVRQTQTTDVVAIRSTTEQVATTVDSTPEPASITATPISGDAGTSLAPDAAAIAIELLTPTPAGGQPRNGDDAP